MQNFISKDFNYAIVGASENTDKWGFKVLKAMIDNGYKVIPVNPKYTLIYNQECFPTLSDISNKVDVVISIIPSVVTINVVTKCKELGIDKVWMQPGSESDEAIKFCEDNNIECIHHACLVVDGLKTSF